MRERCNVMSYALSCPGPASLKVVEDICTARQQNIPSQNNHGMRPRLGPAEFAFDEQSVGARLIANSLNSVWEDADPSWGLTGAGPGDRRASPRNWDIPDAFALRPISTTKQQSYYHSAANVSDR